MVCLSDVFRCPIPRCDVYRRLKGIIVVCVGLDRVVHRYDCGVGNSWKKVDPGRGR